MRCPKCGIDNEAEALVCLACGVPLSDEESTIAFAPAASEAERALDVEHKKVVGPSLVIVEGATVADSFPLGERDISLGRDPASDIFLNDITVSRKHAKIDIKQGDVFISDDGSLNGTYVNGARVDKTVLESGDEIQIGKFKLTFIDEASDREE